MATATAAATSHFFGTRLGNTTSDAGKFHALFKFGTKKAPPAPKKKQVRVTPEEDRLVWFPGAQRPEWLDGSYIGDRGFDPLGFARPAEYLQFDYDGLDQNLAKNLAGDIIGTRVETNEVQPTPFQPYAEVFGIQRFRECEVIHGRWAMLGALGALSVEALTGVAWQDAGKVELVDGSSYLGLPLPFSITTLIWIEVLVIGYIEFQRNAELDPEKRLYPGGKFFDPLGLANDPEEKERLQLAEIKHSRLAMVVFLIFAIQAAVTGKGPISFLATFNK
ncbi:chlorophyll a-b binding protein CP29.3, chloroplastic-like [Lotus japonicus]|uniref:chlorophyll a-b binding protein CP29.3, chloroplastic-like n=1 Tax=Lotus japonicus TaxID=34305 RepID=UPI002588A8A3|nr:chlorophyll a-b binding protein CP29.3, chloroplastic-like [Lotus japonicus]